MTRPVLIIEDDADISESLKYNFEREGLVAVTAPTGEAGLSAALNERDPPRLIILDLMTSQASLQRQQLAVKDILVGTRRQSLARYGLCESDETYVR